MSENQAIYKRRQEKVELVFGHVKRNLGVTSFLLRGLEGVRTEMSLLSLCFNLRRMMTLLGIRGLIHRIAEKAEVCPRFFMPVLGTSDSNLTLDSVLLCLV